jgi:ABC-2 type transport system permease protein
MSTAIDVGPARVFARTCAAEWSRLWSVQATWWFLAAAGAVMIGIGAIAGLESASDTPTSDPAWIASTVTAMPGQFALLALALIGTTSDYGTGGIVPTLQWTPRRGVLFLARTTVAMASATALGVLITAAAALAAFASAHPGLALPLDAGLDALGTVAFVVAAGSGLAVGLGFLLRHTAGVLVTVFLLMLVLPLLLPQFGYEWTSEIAQRLPGSGAAYLLLGGVPGMTQTSSVVTLLVWALGALVLGWLRLARDDANR